MLNNCSLSIREGLRALALYTEKQQICSYRWKSLQRSQQGASQSVFSTVLLIRAYLRYEFYPMNHSASERRCPVFKTLSKSYVYKDINSGDLRGQTYHYLFANLLNLCVYLCAVYVHVYGHLCAFIHKPKEVLRYSTLSVSTFFSLDRGPDLAQSQTGIQQATEWRSKNVSSFLSHLKVTEFPLAQSC